MAELLALGPAALEQVRRALHHDVAADFHRALTLGRLDEHRVAVLVDEEELPVVRRPGGGPVDVDLEGHG